MRDHRSNAGSTFRPSEFPALTKQSAQSFPLGPTLTAQRRNGGHAEEEMRRKGGGAGLLSGGTALGSSPVWASSPVLALERSWGGVGGR